MFFNSGFFFLFSKGIWLQSLVFVLGSSSSPNLWQEKPAVGASGYSSMSASKSRLIPLPLRCSRPANRQDGYHGLLKNTDARGTLKLIFHQLCFKTQNKRKFPLGVGHNNDGLSVITWRLTQILYSINPITSTAFKIDADGSLSNYIVM